MGYMRLIPEVHSLSAMASLVRRTGKAVACMFASRDIMRAPYKFILRAVEEVEI